MKSYTRSLYNGYDRNHKERDKLDYYATPSEEVTNILNVLNLDFSQCNILEPCCGGGHMVKGILDYIFSQQYESKLWRLLATDVQKRESALRDCDWKYGLEYDFLSEDYPYTDGIDYIIMNPPYTLLEPFVMRSLEIADKGVLMLARLQALEGQKRFNNIFKDNPPNDVYVYIQRIYCYKNGNFNMKADSAQAYAWFYWNRKHDNKITQLHWLNRV